MFMNIELDDKKEKEKMKKVKEATAKKQAAIYQPTMIQIWETGYQIDGRKEKKGILQMSLSDSDRVKLIEVKNAIKSGEIGIGIDNLQKFTKTHALRLYKELELSRRDEIINKMIEERPENYITIFSKEGLKKLEADLWKEEEFALDTETTGLDYFNDVIVGMSFTLPKADYHVYIPVGHTEDTPQLNREYVLETLRPVLESEIKKIYFNAKYDLHMFRRHGIKCGGFWFCGYVAMKLLNENETTYSLKNLATKYGKYFGFEDKSATFESLFGKGGFQDVPINIGSIYACKDTHLTYNFYRHFIMVHFNRLPELKKLFFEIERPILKISVEMERNGFQVDLEFAEIYGQELREELAEMDTELKKAFGDVNLNSPAQLGKLLYDVWGLEDISKKRSTDAKTLKELSKQNKALKLLLQYRDINKLLSTYIETMPNRIKHDGRLHGQFNQVDTVTGRFASKEPNLQNLPYRARKLIVAPKGKVLIGIDFSRLK